MDPARDMTKMKSGGESTIGDESGGKIGILADSHGDNALLRAAIDSLRAMSAETLIHLGDICDVQAPDLLDEAVEILIANDVKAVLGNNETSIITDVLDNESVSLREVTVSYVRGLPYIHWMGDMCFAHSTPFSWPAATRRPIEDYYPQLIGSEIPFWILFRGHSHSPSLIEVDAGNICEVPVNGGESYTLLESRSYVITVGAVEKGLFSLYDPRLNEVSFLSLSSHIGSGGR